MWLAIFLSVLVNAPFLAALCAISVRARRPLVAALGFFLAHSVVSAFLLPHLFLASETLPPDASAPVAAYWESTRPLYLIGLPLLSFLPPTWQRGSESIPALAIQWLAGGLFWAFLGMAVVATRNAFRRETAADRPRLEPTSAASAPDRSLR